MDFINTKVSRLINTIWFGKIYAKKRKYFGDKNRAYNGSRKEKRTPDFFTDPLWLTKLTTESP